MKIAQKEGGVLKKFGRLLNFLMLFGIAGAIGKDRGMQMDMQRLKVDATELIPKRSHWKKE